MYCVDADGRRIVDYLGRRVVNAPGADPCECSAEPVGCVGIGHRSIWIPNRITYANTAPGNPDVNPVEVGSPLSYNGVYTVVPGCSGAKPPTENDYPANGVGSVATCGAEYDEGLTGWVPCVGMDLQTLVPGQLYEPVGGSPWTVEYRAALYWLPFLKGIVPDSPLGCLFPPIDPEDLVPCGGDCVNFDRTSFDPAPGWDDLPWLHRGTLVFRAFLPASFSLADTQLNAWPTVAGDGYLAIRRDKWLEATPSYQIDTTAYSISAASDRCLANPCDPDDTDYLRQTQNEAGWLLATSERAPGTVSLGSTFGQVEGFDMRFNRVTRNYDDECPPNELDPLVYPTTAIQIGVRTFV